MQHCKLVPDSFIAIKLNVIHHPTIPFMVIKANPWSLRCFNSIIYIIEEAIWGGRKNYLAHQTFSMNEIDLLWEKISKRMNIIKDRLSFIVKNSWRTYFWKPRIHFSCGSIPKCISDDGQGKKGQHLGFCGWNPEVVKSFRSVFQWPELNYTGTIHSIARVEGTCSQSIWVPRTKENQELVKHTNIF